MTLRLIRPDPRFESSHASFIAEFQASGEELVPRVLAEQRSPFADYLAWLQSSAKGVDLPTGFVPHSTWWLVDDEGEILGVGSLRHELTDDLPRPGGTLAMVCGHRPGVGGMPSMCCASLCSERVVSGSVTGADLPSRQRRVRPNQSTQGW
jgi:hypothetical protein